MNHNLTVHEAVTIYGDNWNRHASQYRHFLATIRDNVTGVNNVINRHHPANCHNSVSNYWSSIQEV